MNVGIGHKSLLAASLCALAACGALGGCKKSGDQAPGGQVIAHVGDDIVTTPELENEFRLRNIPQDKRSDAVTRAIVQEIVGRKYLARQAVDAKIDREPTTLLTIIRAKEQLLGQRYFERRIQTKATEIGKADVAKYIGEHPERFAGRQILSIDQISVVAGQQAKSLAEATKDFRTLAEVENKCVELGVRHNHTNGELDTAAMPENLTKALDKKGGDDLFFIATGPGTGTFFKILSKRAAPLGGDEASKLAHKLLVEQLVKEEKGQAVKDAGAITTFEGDYAKIMKEPAASQPPAAESAPSAPAVADAPPAETSSGDASSLPEATDAMAPPARQADAPKPVAKPKVPAKPKEPSH